MKVSDENRGDVLVCAISGNITGGDSETLGRHEQLSFCRFKTAIDLSKIEYMDSSGLGAIVRIIRDYKQCRTPLALVDPSPFVARTLHMTRLDKIVHVAPDLTAALLLLQSA